MKRLKNSLPHPTAWTLVIAGALLLGIWGIAAIHPFLACNRPISAEMLVVEGWLPASYLPLAAEEFRRGRYRYLVTVGGPLPSTLKTRDQTTYAESARSAMIQLGIDKSFVTAVSAPQANRRRMWTYVQAFRSWLNRSGHEIRAINVFTVGVHGRKSLLLFNKALGPTVQVGVISVRRQGYDPSYWWLSPIGIWLTARYAIGYLDALLFTWNN